MHARGNPSVLRQLATLFLKLGTIAFGGPAAHIGIMENEVVRRRRWLSREEFLDLLGATNLIPGPNSTEMAIHIGLRQAGWLGLLVAGSCFILPAALIVTAFAWTYTRYSSIPEVTDVLYGVKPVIIAVVLQALWGLAKVALRTRSLWAIGTAGIILGFFGVNELVILAAGGLVPAMLHWVRSGRFHFVCVLPGWPASTMSYAGAAATASVAVGLWPLFLSFLKVGSVLYGSGYVLLAFLRADLVERWHWLSEAQLLDAVAVGQVTPGPVFTTATFIGYVLGGPAGALAATVGIFLPAFLFVAVSGPVIPRIRSSATASAFLDGVNVASLALMAVVTWHLGRAALVDFRTIALALISAALLLRFGVNSAWLVLGGACAGLLLHWHA